MVDKNKTTGYIVFALGILLLLVTFSLAIYTYLTPSFIEGFSDLVEVGNEGFAPFVDFLIYLIPALFLFAMGSVAGKITKYGIKMIKSPEKKTVEKGRRSSAQNKRTQPKKKTTDKKKSSAPPKPGKKKSEQPKTEQTKQKQSRSE